MHQSTKNGHPAPTPTHCPRQSPLPNQQNLPVPAPIPSNPELPTSTQTSKSSQSDREPSKTHALRCAKLTDYYNLTSNSDSRARANQNQQQAKSNHRDFEWIEALREKNRQLAEKEKEIQGMKLEKEKTQDKINKQHLAIQNYKKKARETLIQSLKEIYRNKKDDRSRNRQELGELVKDGLRDKFVEGRLFNQNRQKQAKLKGLVAGLTKQLESGLSAEEADIIKQRLVLLQIQLKELEGEMNKLEALKSLATVKGRCYLLEKDCRYAREGWPVVGDRYLTLELLGKGGFSEVYRCYDLEDNTEKALKLSNVSQLTIPPNAKKQHIKHIVRQSKTHKELSHPNIAKLFNVLQSDQVNIVMILQLCEGPDLATYLKQKECLEQEEARCILKQLLSALLYLDSRKPRVIHYDLKPQNIMLDRGLVKIIDFGLCKTIQKEDNSVQLTSQGMGTCWYLPPETFQQRSNVRICSKVDVWSIGIIFYQMLFGKKPFGHGMSQHKVIKQKIIQKNKGVEFEDCPKLHPISAKAKSFIKQCLQYDVEKRLSVKQAFEHEYLK